LPSNVDFLTIATRAAATVSAANHLPADGSPRTGGCPHIADCPIPADRLVRVDLFDPPNSHTEFNVVMPG
jgi:hypothetical protein